MAIIPGTNQTGAGIANASVTTPGSAGDLIIAAVSSRAVGTITPDESGWTSLIDQVANGNTGRLAIYWRYRTGTDPSSFGFTQGSSLQIAATIQPYTGAAIVSASSTDLGGNATTTTTVPSGTVTNDGSYWLGVIFNRDPDIDADVTPPAGFTERGEINTGTGTNDIGVALADKPVNIVDSPTGAVSFTHLTLVIERAAASIILRPADIVIISSPASIYRGEASLVVTGVGFEATQNTGTLVYGGVTATIISWSDTLIEFTDPAVAARLYAPATHTITVTSHSGGSDTTAVIPYTPVATNSYIDLVSPLATDDGYADYHYNLATAGNSATGWQWEWVTLTTPSSKTITGNADSGMILSSASTVNENANMWMINTSGARSSNFNVVFQFASVATSSTGLSLSLSMGM